jgi:hypothetical protein
MERGAPADSGREAQQSSPCKLIPAEEGQREEWWVTEAVEKGLEVAEA